MFVEMRSLDEMEMETETGEDDTCRDLIRRRQRYICASQR